MKTSSEEWEAVKSPIRAAWEWVDEHAPEIVIVFLCLSLAALLVLAVTSKDTEMSACVKGGGAWVVDHYETSYTLVNNVMIPNRYAVHRCERSKQ